MSALRVKNTSESDPCSYEVTLTVANKAQKKFWGSNGIHYIRYICNNWQHLNVCIRLVSGQKVCISTKLLCHTKKAHKFPLYKELHITSEEFAKALPRQTPSNDTSWENAMDVPGQSCALKSNMADVWQSVPVHVAGCHTFRKGVFASSYRALNIQSLMFKEGEKCFLRPVLPMDGVLAKLSRTQVFDLRLSCVSVVVVVVVVDLWNSVKFTALCDLCELGSRLAN